MDERLEKALEFSNFTKTLNDQRRLLKEKFYEDVIFFYNGSQFTVNQTLISFIEVLVQHNNNETVIIDDNDVPVRIDNLASFKESILDLYFQASNSYFIEYQKIKNSRSIEKLINYD